MRNQSCPTRFHSIAIVLLIIPLLNACTVNPDTAPAPTTPPITIEPTSVGAPSQAPNAPTISIPSSVPAATETTRAPSAEPAAHGVLAKVISRGSLNCGINGHLLGFSKKESNGTYSGMDADFCRAVAIAIFGSPKVQLLEVFDRRFDAVRAGDVDVVFANSTTTYTRDVGLGIDFGPTIFHDGQGLLVPKASGIKHIADLGGKQVCIQQGTTSLENVPDILATYQITFTTYITNTIDATYAAYARGLCAAVLSDRSQLASKRTELEEFGAKPDDHVVLDDVLSREPLAPFFIENDSQWAEVIAWVVNCTIAAEELGVDQRNINDKLDSKDPRVRLLLGIEQLASNNPGLPNGFAQQVIKQLGNYKDFYTRNLISTGIILGDRGPNKAWNSPESSGGVLASPPFR